MAETAARSATDLLSEARELTDRILSRWARRLQEEVPGRDGAALAVAVTLPLAVLGAFTGMWLLRAAGLADIQTNIMSLAGLVVSVGVLVDSSIVLTENVMHRLRRRFGDEPVRGNVDATVIAACSSVGRPVFGSILIMLVSFLPVFALGGIDGRMYGPPVRPPQPNLGLTAAFGSSTDWETSTGDDRYRRGIYTTWRRSNPYPSMATFDAPNREVCTMRRGRTNTPLQCLVTLNDPVYVEAAQALARQAIQRTKATGDRIAFAFRCCLSRPTGCCA